MGSYENIRTLIPFLYAKNNKNMVEKRQFTVTTKS